MIDQTFQPVAILAPDPNEMDRALTNIESSTREIEICCPLSSAPPRLWHGLFTRAWRMWFPDVEQPYPGNKKQLIIKATPAQIPSRFNMAKVVIHFTNQMCAPISEGQEAQAIADGTRKDRMERLRVEHDKPVTLPNDQDYETLREMLLTQQSKERNSLTKDIARDELNRAILELTASEIDDVMKRTKGNG